MSGITAALGVGLLVELGYFVEEGTGWTQKQNVLAFRLRVQCAVQLVRVKPVILLTINEPSWI